LLKDPGEVAHRLMIVEQQSEVNAVGVPCCHKNKPFMQESSVTQYKERCV